jgi:hypothetical protein
MSQWAPSPQSLTESPESGPQIGQMNGEKGALSDNDLGSKGPLRQQGSPSMTPWWGRVLPFFLSAFFFLNGFLVAQVPLPWFLRVLVSLSALSMILSPLPLLLVYASQKRSWAWLAILTNSAIVGVTKGLLALSIYLVFVVALSVPLSEGLKRKKSIEKSSAIAFVSMLICGLIVTFTFARVYHFDPVQEFQTLVTGLIDHFGKSAASSSVMVDPVDLDELKHNLVIEFPGSIAIFWLFLIWSNLMLLLRYNPNKIREGLGLDANFFRAWKAPQFLVWPAIVAGVFLLLDFGWVSDVAINVFKFIMAIYAIQGLSILGYFFDIWSIRGPFRWLGYVLSICLMTPLVLSLGFFDLWFDFRGKFRQS